MPGSRAARRPGAGASPTSRLGPSSLWHRPRPTTSRARSSTSMAACWRCSEARRQEEISMLGVVIHAPKDLRVEEIAATELGPRDVQVRIESGGICGSDLHYYHHGGF